MFSIFHFDRFCTLFSSFFLLPPFPSFYFCVGSCSVIVLLFRPGLSGRQIENKNIEPMLQKCTEKHLMYQKEMIEIE